MSKRPTTEHVSVRIDVNSWVAQRVGAEHTGLTAALRAWGPEVPETGNPGRTWMARAVTWCTAQNYPVCDGFPLTHDQEWLTGTVSMVRAYAGERGPVAIVSIDGAPPAVYPDITTDYDSWYDVGWLDIVCRRGHRWAWRGHLVIGADRETRAVTEVFGDHPESPFAPRHTRPAAGPNEDPEPNRGRQVIVCPTCDGRCDLDLPPVPTIAQCRPYAVQVSVRIDYQGWVLAVDTDHAGEQARRLIEESASVAGRGHLDIVRTRRTSSVADATEVCWQCGTDARRLNPACPHPSPCRPAGAGGVAPQATAALRCDAAVIRAWLEAPAAGTAAGESGIDEDGFGPNHRDLLNAVNGLLADSPPGLIYRADIADVQIGFFDNGTFADPSAIIVVELECGDRLATCPQPLGAFLAPDARGIEAALSALEHIAAHACSVVGNFQRHHPAYQATTQTRQPGLAQLRRTAEAFACRTAERRGSHAVSATLGRLPASNVEGAAAWRADRT